MDAFKEALSIMNQAIDSRENTKMRIITSEERKANEEYAQGRQRCWNCYLFCECQEHIGVDDMDSCEQWRE